MSVDMPELTDTRDMIFVHDVFRRALQEAPGEIAAVEAGDTAQAERVGSYLREVLWLLHAHHAGEDELLYPLLVERAPEAHELFSRMDAQHSAVATSIDEADQAAEGFRQSGQGADGDVLAESCQRLLEAVTEHLSEEEHEVLPIAARTITPAEWGALPEHVLSSYRGTRPWLLLGLVFEAMPEQMSQYVLAHMPPPVSEMWQGFGSAAFVSEMAAIRPAAV